MKIKTSSVIWGVLLILLGAIALAGQLDWFSGWDTLALVIVLSILAVIAFAKPSSYLKRMHGLGNKMPIKTPLLPSGGIFTIFLRSLASWITARPMDN